jgi:hypothetical protein
MTERNENETAQHAVQEDTSAFELPFGFTPAHVMAAASLPLCIGTYAGYKRQLKIVQKEAAQHAAEGEVFTITRESKLVARRALGLGTMLSLSGFGLLTSGEWNTRRRCVRGKCKSCVVHLLIVFRPFLQLPFMQAAVDLGNKP